MAARSEFAHSPTRVMKTYWPHQHGTKKLLRPWRDRDWWT